MNDYAFYIAFWNTTAYSWTVHCLYPVHNISEKLVTNWGFSNIILSTYENLEMGKYQTQASLLHIGPVHEFLSNHLAPSESLVR